MCLVIDHLRFLLIGALLMTAYISFYILMGFAAKSSGACALEFCLSMFF